VSTRSQNNDLHPGVGWGLQIGADLTEVVMVLNSDEAVKAFSRGGNVTIGGSISAAAGPIGTGGQLSGSLVNPAPIFSYSRSKGELLSLWGGCGHSNED
jgi:lipid-binding SYLF domain-containing protein